MSVLNLSETVEPFVVDIWVWIELYEEEWVDVEGLEIIDKSVDDDEISEGTDEIMVDEDVCDWEGVTFDVSDCIWEGSKSVLTTVDWVVKNEGLVLELGSWVGLVIGLGLGLVIGLGLGLVIGLGLGLGSDVCSEELTVDDCVVVGVVVGTCEVSEKKYPYRVS